MALSPPHSLEHLTNPPATHSSSGITSFSLNPSFSRPSSFVERFFKILYYMPWIAYERITVDYLPGKVGRVHGHALSRETSVSVVRDASRRRRRSGGGGGGGDRQRKETRDKRRDRWRRKQRRTRADDEKIASWYKSVSPSSQKTSAELHSSSTTTGAIELGLEILPADAASPRSPHTDSIVTSSVKERERRQRDRKENVGDKQQQTSHSRHRRDPDNRHRGKQKRRIGSGSPDAGEDETLNQSPSPLIPAVYPFYYPPYPYPYPYTFTTPSPSGPHTHSQSQSQSHPHPLSSSSSETPNEQTQSRGPRSMASSSSANQGQQPSSSLLHPVFFSPGISHPGYSGPGHAFQPMVIPSTTTDLNKAPQVYLLRSNSQGELEPLSPLSPYDRGGVIGGGRGPEILVDAVIDSG